MEKSTEKRTDEVKEKLDAFLRVVTELQVQFVGVVMFKASSGQLVWSEVYNTGIVERFGSAELLRTSAENEQRIKINQRALDNQFSSMLDNSKKSGIPQ